MPRTGGNGDFDFEFQIQDMALKQAYAEGRRDGVELPICQTCEGRGDGGGFDRNSSHAHNEYVEYPCPDCGGTGRRDVLSAIRDAIENEGPQPDYHQKVMARHRKEWPTLWKAIDAALEDTPQ
jgi:hypothetical protein